MTTKFFVDKLGRYIGGFDGAEPPTGAIEVPSAPASATDVWTNGAWNGMPSPHQEVTRYQGYLALFDVGVTEDMVETKLAELLSGAELDRALLARRTASTFRRDNELVQMIGAAFALDLDALFTNASVLN